MQSLMIHAAISSKNSPTPDFISEPYFENRYNMLMMRDKRIAGVVL
jgi:hypothetical protein